MKKLFFLILLLTSTIYSQGWNNTVTTSIEVPSLITMDLFTNKDGNHIIVQNGYSNYYLKYYLVNSSGTVVRSSTIETTSSAVFPNISGNDDEVYIVYKIGSSLRFRKSTNAGSSWSNAVDQSVGSNTCNGVDIVYDVRGSHVVYAMQDNGDDYETYYRLIDDDEWGSEEDVTGYGSEVGGFPTVTVSEDRVHVSYNTGDQYSPEVNQGDAKSRDKYNSNWLTPQLIFSSESFRERIHPGDSKLFDFYYKFETGFGQYHADLRVKDRSLSGSSWSSSTLLQTYSDVDEIVSAANTSNGNTHIVYPGSGSVVYRYYNGSSWSSESTIGDDYKSPRLFAVSNDLFVIYQYTSNDYLKYRQYDAMPLTPPNFAGEVYSNHPKLTWDKIEPDIAYFEIWWQIVYDMKHPGSWNLLTTTSSTSFVDYGVELGGSPVGWVNYMVRSKDMSGNYSSYTTGRSFAFSGFNKVGGENKPVEYSLNNNYPNPFNPSTQIKYSIAQDADVTLIVYDMLGTEVAKLINETQTAGNHTFNFDAKDLSSGVYIYRITATNNGRILFAESKQMILLR